MAKTGLWRGRAPLLLASASATRRALLESAGLPVDTEAAEIDERAIEASLGEAGARAVASQLARTKALAVSRRHPDRIVIGADQTLSCEGTHFHKPPSRPAAKDQLLALAGRTHALHSAVAIATEGTVVHDFVEEGRLTMRPLSPSAIERYLDIAGDRALQSVGAYQLEGIGVHLFEEVAGDHSTILGLPLLPLVAALRKMDLLAF
jgi:septum formation protein